MLQKKYFPSERLKPFISQNQSRKVQSLSKPAITDKTMRYYKLSFIGKLSAQLKEKFDAVVKKNCKTTTDIKL